MAEVQGGFATSHMADITGPAWLYVTTRGLGYPDRRTVVGRLFGATAERAVTVIFLASAATEVAQLYWPEGLFRGRFDPIDIACFAAGLLPLYLIDRITGRRPAGGGHRPVS